MEQQATNAPAAKNEVIEAIKDEISMNGFQPEMDERFSLLPFIKNGSDGGVIILVVEIRKQGDSQRTARDFVGCFDHRRMYPFT